MDNIMEDHLSQIGPGASATTSRKKPARRSTSKPQTLGTAMEGEEAVDAPKRRTRKPKDPNAPATQRKRKATSEETSETPKPNLEPALLPSRQPKITDLVHSTSVEPTATSLSQPLIASQHSPDHSHHHPLTSHDYQEPPYKMPRRDGFMRSILNNDSPSPPPQEPIPPQSAPTRSSGQSYDPIRGNYDPIRDVRDPYTSPHTAPPSRASASPSIASLVDPSPRASSMSVANAITAMPPLRPQGERLASQPMQLHSHSHSHSPPPLHPPSLAQTPSTPHNLVSPLHKTSSMLSSLPSGMTLSPRASQNFTPTASKNNIDVVEQHHHHHQRHPSQTQFYSVAEPMDTDDTKTSDDTKTVVASTTTTTNANTTTTTATNTPTPTSAAPSTPVRVNTSSFTAVDSKSATSSHVTQDKTDTSRPTLKPNSNTKSEPKAGSKDKESVKKNNKARSTNAPSSPKDVSSSTTNSGIGASTTGHATVNNASGNESTSGPVMEQSILDFGKAKPGDEVEAPSIILEIPIRPGETNKYVNFMRMAEEQYGWDALHPRLAAQRDRRARIAAAAASLEKLGSGRESEEDSSDEITDGEASSAEATNGHALGAAPGSTAKPPARKKRTKQDEYDKEDDFVDDSELLWEEKAAASQDGFFVYSGPLIPEEAKPTVAAEAPKRGRGSRGGRGGTAKATGSSRSTATSKASKEPAPPKSSGVTKSGQPARKRATKSEKAAAAAAAAAAASGNGNGNATDTEKSGKPEKSKSSSNSSSKHGNSLGLMRSSPAQLLVTGDA